MHFFQINFLYVLMCSNILFYLQDWLYWCMYNTLYHTCIYNRLPEEELSGSKHIEGIKQIEIKVFI